MLASKPLLEAMSNEVLKRFFSWNLLENACKYDWWAPHEGVCVR